MKTQNITAIYTIWLREMKKFVRARSRIIGNIAMPFFFLAFLGTGIDATLRLPQAFGGISYLDFLSPGIVAMVLLFSSMFSGISVLWDKEFGFLKEILVAPVSRVSIMLGKVFAGVTTGVIQAFIVIVISLGLGVSFSGGLAGIISSLVYIILISMAFVSLGIAFASRMRDMQGFQIIMNFLIMPVWILSGAFFPITGLPAWLGTLSMINPLTYGVDGLRATLIGVSSVPPLLSVSVLLAFSVAMIILGAWLFRKTEV